jgi:hypothetical protein
MSATIETFTPSPTVKKMLIGSGPVLNNVGVALIFWGKVWGTNPPPTPSAQQFTNVIKSLLNSDYLGSLAQYGVTGPPSLIAVDVATQGDPPTGFNDQQLQAFITSRIDAGALPVPVVANTRFYAVICAQGASASARDATGEHQPFSYKGVAATTAWVLNDGTLDSNFSAVQGFSHELAEACSDPQGGGGVRLIGTDNNNWEIGDICRWGIDTSNGYAIQSYYSAADKACVIPLTRAVNAARAQIAAVSRTPDSLSVAVVDKHGTTYSGAWDQGRRQGRWRGWWSINGGQSRPAGPIGLVARSPRQLDAFVTGTDGRIYAAAWDSTLDVFDGAWRGWWPVVTGEAPPGSPVAAVSRDPDKLDAFVVGGDGRVWTAAWDQNVANGSWRGWWQVVNLVTMPGGCVTAVSRAPGKLDIFAVGEDNAIYTAAWDATVDNGAWRGWWPVAGGRAVPGSRVHAVSRDPNKLDVFVVGTDGGVWTAAWDQNVANGAWRGWWPIGSLASQPGGFVTAVSRDPNKLDVFVVAGDGEVATAAWDQNVANGVWRGWWPIVEGRSAPGDMVSAVSRSPEKLDVFVAGTEGGLWTAAWDQNVANGAWRGWWSIPN